MDLKWFNSRCNQRIKRAESKGLIRKNIDSKRIASSIIDLKSIDSKRIYSKILIENIYSNIDWEYWFEYLFKYWFKEDWFNNSDWKYWVKKESS